MASQKVNSKRFLKRALSLGGLILVAFLCIFYLWKAYTTTGTILPTSELFDGLPTVRFLDVGQGDCALIKYQGHAMLIDAGPDSCADETAEYVRRYAPNIDCFLLSHPHDDHCGGADEILKVCHVKLLLIGEREVNAEEYAPILKLAKKRGIPIQTVAEASEMNFGEIHVEILDTFELEYDNYNDASLVASVTANGITALFMGDAEADEEAVLLWREPEALDCDILKVGHHGSATSTSERFLEAATPEKCVISCGKHNSYGHPKPEVLERLRAIGAEIYRTDRKGTVILKFSTKQ